MAQVSTITGQLATYYSSTKGSNTAVYNRTTEFKAKGNQRIGKTAMNCNRYHTIQKNARRNSNHNENSVKIKDKSNRQIDISDSTHVTCNDINTNNSERSSRRSHYISKNAHNHYGQNGRNQNNHSESGLRVHSIDNEASLTSVSRDSCYTG